MNALLSLLTRVHAAPMICVVFVLALLCGQVHGEDGWRFGRATFYGIHWSLHHGSCGYGHLDYHRNTGWDVAAISNWHYEYHGSCGACYEIKCHNMNFKDNYGNHLDRSHACYDTNKVVTVAIVDSCPCHYKPNAYSNKRWCCQDMDHLDISYHAYDKLADRKWGVIGLKYRPVACPDPSYLHRRNHHPPNGGRKLRATPEERHSTEDGAQILILDEGVTEFDPTLRGYIQRGSMTL